MKIQYFGNVKIHYLMLYFVQSKTSILECISGFGNVFPNSHSIFYIFRNDYLKMYIQI